MTWSARLFACGAAAVVIGLGAFWILTLPAVVPASALPAYTPNLGNGQTMFNIGGCASCHAVPNMNPDKVDRTRLGGGLALKSPVRHFLRAEYFARSEGRHRQLERGEFRHRVVEGDLADSARTCTRHFPIPPFTHMQLDDVRDLFAYLKTLPPVPGKVRRHDLSFPFNERRLLGGWKLLFLHGGPFVPDPSKSAQWNRGAYLVNGPGHCAECHSPRDLLGGIIDSERFAGGPAPDGSGWVPNITPTGLQHGDCDMDAKDIASFLGDDMMPSGDFAGGGMADIIRNTSLLGADDRAAIAAYIVSLPPTQGPTPPPKKN